MGVIKIIIVPLINDLILSVDDNFCKKVFNKLEKLKKSQNSFFSFEYPDYGYCGMVLICENSLRITVNGKKIMMAHDNVLELLYDTNEDISKLLLEKACVKYFKELNYYFTVKNYGIKRIKSTNYYKEMKYYK